MVWSVGAVEAVWAAIGFVLGAGLMALWCRVRAARLRRTVATLRADIARDAVVKTTPPAPAEALPTASHAAPNPGDTENKEMAQLRADLARAEASLAQKVEEMIALQADLDAAMAEALVAPATYHASFEDPAAPDPGRLPAPALLTHPREGQADPLDTLKGVEGPHLRALHRLGVFHLDQVAEWSAGHQAWIAAKLGTLADCDQVARWSAEARTLSDTRHALID